MKTVYGVAVSNPNQKDKRNLCTREIRSEFMKYEIITFDTQEEAMELIKKHYSNQLCEIVPLIKLSPV